MVQIRLATADELEQLAVIEIKASKRFPKGKLPEPDKSTPLPLLFQALQAQLLFCADVNNSVVGFASCHIYDQCLHLDELSVLQDHGRQGIGGKLVDHLKIECRKRKLSTISLLTFADIPWNAPFYRKHGFESLEDSAAPEYLRALLAEEKTMGLSNRVAMVFRYEAHRRDSHARNPLHS